MGSGCGTLHAGKWFSARKYSTFSGPSIKVIESVSENKFDWLHVNGKDITTLIFRDVFLILKIPIMVWSIMMPHCKNGCRMWTWINTQHLRCQFCQIWAILSHSAWRSCVCMRKHTQWHTMKIVLAIICFSHWNTIRLSLILAVEYEFKRVYKCVGNDKSYIKLVGMNKYIVWHVNKTLNAIASDQK